MQTLKVEFQEDENPNLCLTLKWGADGSSGHSAYKQKFSVDEASDSSMYSICLVPLSLKKIDSGEIICKNPLPNSVRFCRPIRLLMQKKSEDLIQKEIMSIEVEIENLVPIQICNDGKEIVIYPEFELSMIDGKTFNAITNTSNQSCAICRATPKLMNDIKKILKRKCNKNNLAYGLSSLHAHVRCMEYILHVSYRLCLPNKKWRVTVKADKDRCKLRKKLIQKKLRKKLGLLVDMPKVNYGSTNDGNTARSIFKNCKMVAEITGFDESLIARLGILLKTISCGYQVDTDSFRQYALETAKNVCLSLSVVLHAIFHA